MRSVALLAGAVVLTASGCTSDRPDGPSTGDGSLVRVPGVVVQPGTAALTRSGERIVVPCDGDLCVWTTADGALVDRWEGGSVVASSTAGDVLATSRTSGDRAEVVLLDGATGEELATADAHEAAGTRDGTGGGVVALAFSGDGRLVASAGADGAVRLWTVPAAEGAGELDLDCAEPSALAFAPGSDLLAVSCADGPAEVWDTGTTERAAVLDAPPQGGLAWRPDGQQLATASHAPGPEAGVATWDAPDFTDGGPRLDGVEADRLAFDPAGERLAMTVKGEREVRVWSVGSDEVTTLSGATDTPRAVLWSADGASVYAVSGRDGVVAWDVAAGDARAFEEPQVG